MLQSLSYMYGIYFSAHLKFSCHAFQKYLKLIQAVSALIQKNAALCRKKVTACCTTGCDCSHPNKHDRTYLRGCRNFKSIP